ncbi:unnamed protein product [Dicrocoelium dendriticum]|nr:unnamed protein product [Dicrocoelium dendriticum]
MQRKHDYTYGVTVDVIGQTKVNGPNYLNESLANSVLYRQLEKGLAPGVAKFLPDRVHFSRATMGAQRLYRRDIPYDDVRRIYTFHHKPDHFMMCFEGENEGCRMYQTFRTQNNADLNTIKGMIYGVQGRYNRSFERDHDYLDAHATNVVFSTEPPRPAVVIEQPHYNYMASARTPSPLYVERVTTVREQTPSPVYVRRKSTIRNNVPPPPTPAPTVVQTQTTYARSAQTFANEPDPDPVILRRVDRPLETVTQEAYLDHPPSPVVVRRTVGRPASLIFVDDAPAHEETVYLEREPSPVVHHYGTQLLEPPQLPTTSTYVYTGSPHVHFKETVTEPFMVQHVEQPPPIIKSQYGERVTTYEGCEPVLSRRGSTRTYPVEMGYGQPEVDTMTLRRVPRFSPRRG